MDLIELAQAHGKSNNDITQSERLNCLDSSPASFLHLQRTIRERLHRESAIPDEDIEHAVKQIIDLPFLGGKKGSLKLQADEKALLGETVYKEIKQQLRLKAEKELFKRKEQSELEKNQYKRLHEKEKPYEQVVPRKKHDIWAIDFVTFLLFGIYFKICVVYEIFSQAYLAIKPAEVGSNELAKEAVTSACEYSGAKPQKYLLSDNGKQFICNDFEELLDTLKITGQQIPPGQPWHNGALESGNRDLKKVIYTIAFQQACKDIEISRTGAPRQKILSGLEDYCDKTQQVINEQIVRPKFKTTPMAVLTDKAAEKNKQRNLFIANKLKERKQRMEHIKKQGACKRKRIEDKVTAAWKKISALMNKDELFAFSELINERYRAVSI